MSVPSLPINNRRSDSQINLGRFRGGKLVPVNFTPIEPNEVGRITTNVALELDAVVGRQTSPIMGELHQIFVPVQAMHALKNPTDPHAGLSEVITQELLTGNPLFGLVAENAISRKARVVPVSMGGVRQVSEMVHLSYSCAVNMLRQGKFVDAVKLTSANTAITPAIITSSILEIFNAVLSPDPNINGAVTLGFPAQDMKLRSRARAVQGAGYNGVIVTSAASGTAPVATSAFMPSSSSVTDIGTDFEWNDMYSRMDAVTADISLNDLHNAEIRDKIVRQARAIIEENPEYGHEIVRRWFHGLMVDVGKMPFYLAPPRRVFFGQGVKRPSDTSGVLDEIIVSEGSALLSVKSFVPRTDLGGMIVTLVAVKPDEVIASQPHPILSAPWGMRNYQADTLVIDPVKVNFRELDADCGSAKESLLAFYTGHNAMLQRYNTYGFARDIAANGITAKTSVWQYEIPLSVDPSNILYPENLPHTPFVDMAADVVLFQSETSASFDTAIVFGPTPVENVPIIQTDDLLEVLE